MKKIAFIGAGNMNGAIISGLIKQDYPAANIIVSNPSPEKRLALHQELGIYHTDNNIEAAKFADFIVLGVKPHFIVDVCQQLTKEIDCSDKCFISVAAGCPINAMEQALNKKGSVIRTMPNTPSQLGLGATGIFACPQTSEQQKQTAEEIMSAVGIVKWVDSEDKINEITAISGSGPAYFFLFMEAMEKQAKAFGFSEKDSRELVQQTALGAAQMVVNIDLPISKLRENVTSKGGTTHAALQSFIDEGLPQLVTNAMNSALNRAKEMAKNS